MPLQSYKQKDFAQKLRKNGFHVERNQGGHQIWSKKTTISIPAHGEINGALARRLIKENHLE